MQHLGEIISLVVAISWTVTALFADKASHRLGSMSANVIRLVLAAFFLAALLSCAAASAGKVLDKIREGLEKVKEAVKEVKSTVTEATSEDLPEIGNLLNLLMNMPSGGGNPGVFREETKPQAEPKPQEEADTSSWKTLADVLSLETDSREASWDEHSYVCIFRYAGTEWLVRAPFSKELDDAVRAVDYLAEDRKEQINAIIGPCEITKVIDLRTLALPQDELDQWIGKTGQDLLDAGWEYNGYHSDGTGLHICMVNGDFQYLVSFAEKLTMTQVFGEQPENMATATVTGIGFDGKSYHFDETKYLPD